MTQEYFKKNLEQLQQIKDRILKDVEEYNKLAERSDFDHRLALADANLFANDWLQELDSEYEDAKDGFEKAESKANFILEYKSNSYDHPTYVELHQPGVINYYWFPSGINC